MPGQNRKKGSLASGQGKILEETVISTFTRKGFEVVMWSEWNRHRGNFGSELLLKNVPFKNIYGHDGYTEFLLMSEKYNFEVRIECKWQQSAGSVDEKFPYLYLNCIEAMPEKHIVIIVDGGGAKEGAVRWLKNASHNRIYADEKSSSKNIEVMDLSGFLRWANLTFR